HDYLDRGGLFPKPPVGRVQILDVIEAELDRLGHAHIVAGLPRAHNRDPRTRHKQRRRGGAAPPRRRWSERSRPTVTVARDLFLLADPEVVREDVPLAVPAMDV